MSVCPTCGSPVRVVSSDEGTSHYDPITTERRHVALLIEVPALYTDDLDGRLAASRAEFASESEWLLHCIAVGGPVELRLEVNREEVVEVWGDIRGAQLVEPGWGGELTDDKLRDRGERSAARAFHG